jgi:GNAT superfamily N-acetyltransferase
MNARRPDLTIRMGAHADAACLAALGTQVWLHTYARSGIRPALARYVQEHLSPAAYQHQLDRSDAFTLVAEVDEHLVAYAMSELGRACLAPSPASTHLDKLYVQEHFVGTGIGSALLAAVRAETLRRAGSPALWVTVNSQNQQARAFYTRRGFTDIGLSNFDLYGEQHENRILHALPGDPS